MATKKITLNELRNLVKKIIKESNEDYSYQIKSVDCNKNIMSGCVDVDDEGVIHITYCKGNTNDLEYLKEKGRRLVNTRFKLPDL